MLIQKLTLKLKIQKFMKHLIKRKDLGYTITQGWRCEVKLGSSPSGFKAQKNDIVFMAQNGYAIFAKAVITKLSFLSQGSDLDFD